MRISRKQTIDNIPILKIRDFFSYLSSYHTETFTKEETCEYFKIDDLKADSLLEHLLNG